MCEVVDPSESPDIVGSASATNAPSVTFSAWASRSIATRGIVAGSVTSGLLALIACLTLVICKRRKVQDADEGQEERSMEATE
jgi:hypothetical protein